MAGKKDLTLYTRNGKVINSRYRYKSLRSAVRKAVCISLSTHATVQIWHLSRGQELVLIYRYKGQVVLNLPHPRLFDNFWSSV